MIRSCVNGLITIPNLSYSAVLTVFNAENTVGRAIRSILAQSLSPSEILIIYDGPVSFKIKNFVEKLKKKLPMQMAKESDSYR